MYLKVENNQVKVVGKNAYHNLVADFDVKVGDIVFIVTAIYTTGDSFNTSSGNEETIGVWKTAEKAMAAAKEVRRTAQAYADDSNAQEYTAKFVSESGKEWQDGWPSWCGYFESLDDVDVKTYLVGA